MTGRYRANVKIENFNNETLNYQWRLFVRPALTAEFVMNTSYEKIFILVNGEEVRFSPTIVELSSLCMVPNLVSAIPKLYGLANACLVRCDEL